ncbi:ArsJ-associated glyceraldehyde-3-phosphate dehydrogenase [Granulosicoccus sp.]|nr:ArsJ-associated glyceraldehyde-3-phosphate dehydrogenase [Granulosicoccus sp.]MDB4222796.1 ArsJ-associated glyceraldehyde-3-phosphate dehydrogenase [Granulosicoccus sp.]
MNRPVRIGINGLGRIGRLALRAAWGNPAFTVTHLNEIAGDAAMMAHLLEFDSIHGKWNRQMMASDTHLTIDDHSMRFSAWNSPADGAWEDVDIVLECSGAFCTAETIDPYFAQGAAKVVVSAPMPEHDALNIVMGVNHERYRASEHHLITAASCTTNCLAPVIKVMLENVGIRHGTMTTIHDITNTQTIIDAPHKDWRRARANSLSLIPTSTGSAKAIGAIFPQLVGKLDGLAVRVPLLNASLTDCVFEVARPVTVDDVNGWMSIASQGSLNGILGYEERPLVSVDYRTAPRSAIVDALSTRVINGTQVKILAWYDNEWGYANRLVELASLVASQLDVS